MMRNETIPASQRGFTADDHFALAEVKKYYAAETKKCKESPGITTLTENEFERASGDFKELIEIPKTKNQPIYIAREFYPADTLNPQLQKIVAAIKAGKPYHEFITASMGVMWPLLLRLYFGLHSGFKISIEQLHSMMKVCYWRDRDFKIINVPVLDKNTNNFTRPSELLINCMFTPAQRKQKEKFLAALHAEEIPSGERMLQMILINPHYFRIALSSITVKRSLQ